MSERRPSLAIPVALFAGCCVIAAAVFFGLRSRAERPARPSVAPPKATPPATATEPAAGPVAPPTADRASVDAAARAALRERHPTLLEQCWRPALTKTPEPARARYQLDISFDAAGRQVSRGVIEQRDESRADVARCLRAQPMDLRIPAPGARARVLLDLAFP